MWQKTEEDFHGNGDDDLDSSYDVEADAVDKTTNDAAYMLSVLLPVRLLMMLDL